MLWLAVTVFNNTKKAVIEEYLDVGRSGPALRDIVRKAIVNDSLVTVDKRGITKGGAVRHAMAHACAI